MSRREFPGVRILDPARVWIEDAVEVGSESVLYPDVALLGSTVVGRGCVLHQGAVAARHRARGRCGHRALQRARRRPRRRRLQGRAVRALAAGAVLEKDVRVGNFVEVKNRAWARERRPAISPTSATPRWARAPTSAPVVVTCNYDGERKHATSIGKGAFVGSDTMLVAPVRVGDDATTARGLGGDPGRARRRAGGRAQQAAQHSTAGRPGAAGGARKRRVERMCGIVGYLGEREVVPLLLDGLRRLEYRGYDSAGVVVVRDGELDAVKAEGKLDRPGREARRQHLAGRSGLGPHPLGDARRAIREKRPPGV
jgi:acetyltransferase-like isoleucine patch superfamily enzyme